jgi:hypothetical protein
MIIDVTSVAQLREIVCPLPVPVSSFDNPRPLICSSVPLLIPLPATDQKPRVFPRRFPRRLVWSLPCPFLLFLPPSSPCSPFPPPRSSWSNSSTSSPTRSARSASTRSTSLPRRRSRNLSAASTSCPPSLSTSRAPPSTPWLAQIPMVSGSVSSLLFSPHRMPPCRLPCPFLSLPPDDGQEPLPVDATLPTRIDIPRPFPTRKFDPLTPLGLACLSHFVARSSRRLVSLHPTISSLHTSPPQTQGNAITTITRHPFTHFLLILGFLLVYTYLISLVQSPIHRVSCISTPPSRTRAAIDAFSLSTTPLQLEEHNKQQHPLTPEELELSVSSYSLTSPLVVVKVPPIHPFGTVPSPIPLVRPSPSPSPHRHATPHSFLFY